MLAALIDAGVPLEKINEAIGSLGLPGCRLTAREVRKLGVRATQATVEYEHEHAHRGLGQILAMIDAGRLSARQKDIARRIFTRLGEAEAKVHGVPVEKIHFHEVGAADSIANVVGTAVGWDLLAAERLVASPIPTGGGRIRIAHGEFSVPAPATAELLRGVPLAESAIEAELTTPTGAAIVTTLAERFGPAPAMTLERIGVGAGCRDLPQQANVLRLLVGEAAEEAAAADQVCVLETNLDNVSGELVGYCIERLWDAAALDVYTTPIAMKKNRPGVKLTVLCRPADAAGVEAVLFRETPTLGVRRWLADRRVLPRAGQRGRDALGAGRGKAELARGRSTAFCARIRVVPPHRAGAGPPASRGLRGGGGGLSEGPARMTAALKFTDPSFWALVAMAVAAGLLMFRSNRYYARQRRAEASRREGDLPGGMSHACVGMSGSSPPEPCRKPAPPHMPTQASDMPPGSPGASPGGWEVQMHDTARELSAQLDSKMSALRALVAEADRAAARLEAALERSDGFGPPPTHQAQSLAAAAESRRDSLLSNVAPRAHRHEEVYTLADYGYAPAEIARRLGTPIGEVELILSLRGQEKRD